MKINSTSTIFSENNKCIIENTDCLVGIRQLPNESVDLVITSPPYFMGKKYDLSNNVKDFVNLHINLLPELIRVTKMGGSICWQVGYHAKNGSVIPLDYIIYDIFNKSTDLFLRNRIIWTFEHGLHSQKRFSGRHEIILWFTRGDEYYFNLDNVRIPQKYPGKKYYKGTKKGEFSGNPLGKNPSDVWTIPNVKALHIEKTEHPCQFPVALAQRLVRALCPSDGRVLDPFLGAGSTGVAALVEKRKFVGFELEEKYFKIAKVRCEQALSGEAVFRPLEKPILEPDPNTSVARKPENFK